MKYLNFCTKIKCVNIKQAYLVIIFQECHNFAIKRNLAMELQTIHTIINLLCTSGFITTFLYYGSRKRKEAALASQEENKAISSYADEWKELYERSNGMVVNLNGKVDSLYHPAPCRPRSPMAQRLQAGRAAFLFRADCTLS